MDYKKINIFVNGEYITTAISYKGAQALRQRLRADKRIFYYVDGKETVKDLCDYDRLTLSYAD